MKILNLFLKNEISKIKGLWDLIDTGLEIDILQNKEHLDKYQLISLIITGLAGYSIHFFLLFLQRFKLGFIVKEIVQVLAYLTVVLVCLNKDYYFIN
jgi:hypothetical protein